MLARVLFFPSLGINAMMTRITSQRWYDRIDQTVILGALPVKSITSKLIKEEHIKAMVSVNEDFELKHLTYPLEALKAMGIDHLQIRTKDFTGTPTQENIIKAVDFILTHKAHGNTVYLHCKAGRTRSATIAACYLMKVNSWKPEQALQLLHEKRSQVWLRKNQIKSITLYYKIHVKSSST